MKKEKERETPYLYICIHLRIYPAVSSFLSSSLKSDRPQAPWGRRYYMLSPWKVWEPAWGGTRYLYLGISPSLCHNAQRRDTRERRADSPSLIAPRSSESTVPSSIRPFPYYVSPSCFPSFTPSFSQSIRLLYAKLRRPSTMHAEHGTAHGTSVSTCEQTRAWSWLTRIP